MIREHVPNTRFLIGGDGPLRPGFERLVARAGWRDVVFMGRVSEELKRSLYTTADVFCAPNVGGESQGVVLLEALASGRAVVASDIAGFRSVIDHQSNGLLVPPKRSEELAWAVCHLLNDRAERRRLEVAARLRAEAFNWERVATQVLNFYEETRATRAVAESRLITADSATISLAE
jgi:phosphatidylinositol alpha-mannosyltransferase